MDKCATSLYPFLLEYNPCFKPDMLDVLLLSRLDNMWRLQNIQQYLHGRCTQAKKRITILADPQDGCFAARYFEHTEKLHGLEKRVNTASIKSRDAKKMELQEMNRDYRDRTEKMSQTFCTQRRSPDGTHKIHGCTHCWHVRSRRRPKFKSMRIPCQIALVKNAPFYSSSRLLQRLQHIAVLLGKSSTASLLSFCQFWKKHRRCSWVTILSLRFITETARPFIWRQRQSLILEHILIPKSYLLTP